MMELRTGTLEAADGARLFTRIAELDHPRGRLLAVHGLGEHSGRLDRVARCAAAAEFDFCAFDLRGHGRSDGRRGHVRSFERLLSDLDAFRRHVADRDARLPTFVLGHSLGALAAGRYVQEYGFPSLAGAVLVTPFVDLAMRPSTWKLWLSRAVNPVLPWLVVDNEIRADMLFRSTAEQVEHEEDPLTHHRVSVRMWNEMRQAAGVLMGRAGQSRVPTLLQLAGEDRVVSTAAARDLGNRLGGDCRIIEYEHAFHDLYHDPAGEAAAADLVRWLDDRLEVGGGAGAHATL